MFERKISGLFGRDSLRFPEKQVPIKVRQTSMFERRGVGLPSFKAEKLKRTPFQLSLLEVSNGHFGQAPFSKIALEFLEDGNLDPDMQGLLRIGLEYHTHGAAGAGSAIGKSGVTAEIIVPEIRVSPGKRQVLIGNNAVSVAGTLVAIVEGRVLDGGRTVLDGLAILDGADSDSTRIRVVGIDPKKGIVFFHPDFMPGVTPTKSVEQVVIPQNVDKTPSNPSGL